MEDWRSWEDSYTEVLNKRYETTRDIVEIYLKECVRNIVDSSGLVPEKHVNKSSNRTYWMGVQNQPSRREYMLGFIEISPVFSESTKPVTVRVVCSWNPYLEYWRKFAYALDNLLALSTTEIPSQGKILFRGNPDAFLDYFSNQVMKQMNPSFRGLSVGIVEEKNGIIYIHWYDKNGESSLEQVRVVIDPSGNHSLLTIYGLNEAWFRLGWWWELLYKRMENDDMVEVVIPWDVETSEGENRLSRLLPTEESTLDKYKEAWEIWLQMTEEYKEDVLDNRSKRAKPTNADYRARVIKELEWGVDVRTLSTVKMLGKAGLLDR